MHEPEFDPHGDVGDDVLSSLLDKSHLAAPHELPQIVARHSPALGAREAVIFLADLQQRTLVPFLGSAGPDAAVQIDSLSVDASLGGRAFQHIEVLSQAASNGIRMWYPLVDGTDRLGVLAVTVDDQGGDRAHRRDLRLRRVSSLVAELLVTKTAYGDAIVCARRQADMGLAAEMQWSLLPPLTFACRQLTVAAALEPAYQVAGDSVDYAVDAGVARFAIFDGMGHGLRSAQLTTLAVAAYRNARRSGRTLTDTAQRIHTAVTDSFRADGFATAVLAELDTETGLLRWTIAGHPAPLLLREGRLVKSLVSRPALPLGLAVAGHTSVITVSTEQLQPGDQLLLFTDGVVEARSPAGEFFGDRRLADLLTRNLAAGLPMPETMRRVMRALLDHQQNQLTDDATLLLVEWLGGQRQDLRGNNETLLP